MKRLLEVLAQELVEEPERVRVSERSAAGRMCLALKVGRFDRGRVIGRDGRTVAALETLLDAVARLRGQRCEVEVLD